MNSSIIYESMKFNDYLRRNETSLISNKKWQLLSELIYSITRNENENDDDEDQDENFDIDKNKIEILEWEKEWWQKIDAKLNNWVNI